MVNRLHISDVAPDDVLVVGSVAYDGISTPKRTVERVLGGAASYAALAASFFSPVKLVGVVGKDFEPTDKARFEKRGIDLRGLQNNLEGSTFFWKGRYLEDFCHRETLETQLNVFSEFHPHLPEDYPQSPFLFLGNIGPDLQHCVLDQIEAAQAKPFVVADTMNFWIQSQLAGLLELIKRIHCLVINDEEAVDLTHEQNLFLAGQALQRMGPAIVIIKKGEHGALLFYEDAFFSLPAYPVVHLEDPTGAGDSFAGALIAVLAAQKAVHFSAFKKAMLYATVVASLAVEDFSTYRIEQGGEVEIARRVERLKHMISLN